MPYSISVTELQKQLAAGSAVQPVVIDVRKENALAESGQMIAGALLRRPFSADQWRREFNDQQVVVYCAHGHEVSQAVCGFLRDHGIAATYLAGGFEAWRAAGGAVAAIGAR